MRPTPKTHATTLLLLTTALLLGAGCDAGETAEPSGDAPHRVRVANVPVETADGKRLIVTAHAAWRVTDQDAFAKTYGGQDQAHERIQAALADAVRRAFAQTHSSAAAEEPDGLWVPEQVGQAAHQFLASTDGAAQGVDIESVQVLAWVAQTIPGAPDRSPGKPKDANATNPAATTGDR